MKNENVIITWPKLRKRRIIKTFEDYNFGKKIDFSHRNKEHTEEENFDTIVSDILDKFKGVKFEYIDLSSLPYQTRFPKDYINDIKIKGDIDYISVDMEDEEEASFGFRIGGKINKNAIYVYKSKFKTLSVKSLQDYKDLASYVCKRFQMNEFEYKLLEEIENLNGQKREEIHSRI